MISCSKCSFTAPSYYKLNKHIDAVHNNVMHICNKCEKKFASANSLNKHNGVCTGLHCLQCKYCLSFYATRLTKYRHSLICPCRPDDPPQASDNTELQQTEQSEIIEERPKSTIVVFERSYAKCTQFITSHITLTDMRSIIFDYYNEKKKNRHLNVYIEYVQRLFSNPNNKCIIKPNIKRTSSKIHQGDGEWRRYEDEDVIEKVRIDIAKTFMRHLEALEDENQYHLTKRIYKLRGELEFLTNNVFDDEGHSMMRDMRYVNRSIINSILLR
jgi:hypothetical protein